MAIDQAAENARRSAVRRLTELRERLQREIAALLSRLDTRNGVLTSDGEALAQAAETKLNVDRALANAGVGELDDELVELVADMVEAVAEEYGIEFSPDSLTEVEAIARDALRDVRGNWENAIDEIQRAVDLGVTTGLDLGDVTRAVALQLETTQKRAETAVDTAIMGAQRAATLDLAEGAGVDLYEYVGPTGGGNLRPFCSELVGKVFSKEALDSLENDPLRGNQPSPVSVYLGGYNCRHSLAPITREQATARGLDIFE